MSEHVTNQTVVERLIEELWNQQRLNVLPDLVHRNTVFHSPAGTIEGRDTVLEEFIKPTQSAFPDMHHEICDIIVSGDKIAMRYRGTGTHEEEFDGKAATGKQLNYEGIVFFHFLDNRVSEVWNYSNWSDRFAEL